MHEMGFAEQVVESVVREAAAYPGTKVIRVGMRAGKMLALEPDSLRFCIEAISTGTVMEGAEIDLVEATLELDCPECGHVEPGTPLDWTCPRCGRAAEPVLGAELVIEEIELDDEEDSS